MRGIKKVVTWFLHTPVGRLLLAYMDSQAGNFASGLAFNSFISMFPLILGLLAIVGLVTGGSVSAQQHFLQGASTFFPSDSQTALSSLLGFVNRYSGVLGTVGLLGLIWSGSSLFTSMEFTLGLVVGSKQRDFLRQRAMSVLMTIVFVVAVLASIGINSLLSLAPAFAPAAPIVGLLVWLGFFTAIYRLVPNRTYRLRQLWPGVVLGGVLMEVLSLLWPLYTGLSHGFNTYGQTLALFFVLATWLYFLAQFILIGGVANRMHNGPPHALGIVATRQPEPLDTMATRAADKHARRRGA